MPNIAAGPAQPVQTSNQTPAAGPAVPVAVVSDGRNVLAGPAMSVVEVADNRARQGGAAMPVIVGSGSGFTVAGPPLPVYVVSGSLSPSAPVLPDVASATRILDLRANTGVTTSTASFAGTGMITQLLTDVTGIGTAFLSEVVVGDRITSSGSTINGIVQSITDDTNLTLDTSATVGGDLSFDIIPQAGTARVTNWIDQSSGAHDFTQSGLARPSLQTIGGNLALVLNGFNQWLEGPDFADNLSSFTVFLAATLIGVESPPPGNFPHLLTKIQNYFSQPGWAVAFPIPLLYVQGPSGDTWNSFGTVTNNTNIKTLYTFELLTYNSGNAYLNGVLDNADPQGTADVVTTANTKTVRIGASGDLGGGFAFVNINAVMMYVPAPNASDRAAIEAWLMTQWGI